MSIFQRGFNESSRESSYFECGSLSRVRLIRQDGQMVSTLKMPIFPAFIASKHLSKHLDTKNGLLEAIFQEPVMPDNTGGVGGI